MIWPSGNVTVRQRPSSRAAVAQDLTVHPQTVAYRMEGVRRAFSDQLATAEVRWALLLALRCEQQGRTG